MLDFNFYCAVMVVWEGAIYFERANNLVSNCSFKGNSAAIKGGAIYLTQSCDSIKITGSNAESNHACGQCDDVYCLDNEGYSHSFA